MTESALLTEELDGWAKDSRPVSPRSLLSRSLSALDRLAMAVAVVAVRMLVRAINLGFRMVERS